MTTKIVVPPKLAEELTPEREELLKHRMTEVNLTHAVENNPIAVELLEAGRTSSKLRVKGEVMFFYLPEPDHGHTELKLTTSWKARGFEQRDIALWKLAFHRAAEAMLAVRNNHKKRTKKLRKAKAEREATQADT